MGILGTTTTSSSIPLDKDSSNMYIFSWLKVRVPLLWNRMFFFSHLSLNNKYVFLNHRLRVFFATELEYKKKSFTYSMHTQHLQRNHLLLVDTKGIHKRQE